MKPSQVLRAAMEKISAPHAWAIGALAYDGSGQIVAPNAGEAQAWCAVGAMCAVREVGRVTPEIRAIARRIAMAIDWPDGVGDWNDCYGRTHADVLSALKRAAELAESEGQ